jgi:shikimate dehydrogenase
MADRYFVLGNPVAHSQSPFIHAEFAQATGQVLDYGRLLCPLGGFAGAVRALVADTSAGAVQGCNVTVPFKFDAFALAPRHTARAALAGAANTLRFDPEGWLADNTDGAGLVRDITHNAGVPIAGQRVLLVGAGGATAGVLGPLLAQAPAAIVVANRTVAKANSLVQRHAGWAAEHGVALRACGLADAGLGFQIVINASASSLHGGAVPVSADTLAPDALAVDLMYGAPAAPFMAWAQAHGASARDGLGMLVEQAAESFYLWRGVRPQTAAVLAALRQRLGSAK